MDFSTTRTIVNRVFILGGEADACEPNLTTVGLEMQQSLCVGRETLLEEVQFHSCAQHDVAHHLPDCCC